MIHFSAKRTIASLPRRWDARIVNEWLTEAGQTLRKLPPVRVQGYRSQWPEVVRDFWDAYGWHEAVMPPMCATALELDRLDAVLRWQTHLRSDLDRRLFWLRLMRVRWKKIAAWLNLSERHAQREYTSICIALAYVFNQQQFNPEVKKNDKR